MSSCTYFCRVKWPVTFKVFVELVLPGRGVGIKQLFRDWSTGPCIWQCRLQFSIRIGNRSLSSHLPSLSTLVVRLCSVLLRKHIFLFMTYHGVTTQCVSYDKPLHCICVMHVWRFSACCTLKCQRVSRLSCIRVLIKAYIPAFMGGIFCENIVFHG